MNRHMYILADGGRIAASGPSEFVRVLREGDTPEHFMDDLKKYGYIKG